MRGGEDHPGMLRFLLTIVIASILLGSVALCQHRLTRQVAFSIARDVHGHAGETPAQHGREPHTLMLTPGFDAADNPFALRVETAAAPRIVVRHAGRDLAAWTNDVARGTVLAFSNLFFEGESVELHVEASPSPDAARRPCALRLRLLQGGVACDERTLWSRGGGDRLSGSVKMDLAPRLQSLDRGLGARADG